MLSQHDLLLQGVRIHSSLLTIEKSCTHPFEIAPSLYCQCNCCQIANKKSGVTAAHTAVVANLAQQLAGSQPELLNSLAPSGTRPPTWAPLHMLAEARNWGIGMDKGDMRTKNPQQWLGTNMLGWALMIRVPSHEPEVSIAASNSTSMLRSLP